MRATPRQFHSLLKSFARALTKGGVIHLVIDLVDIFREAWSKAFQCPDREPLRVYLLGHVPGRFAGLGGSSQFVEHLRCRRAKQTLHHGPESHLLSPASEFPEPTTGSPLTKR